VPNYTVCVIRSFIAQHVLIGGDWGRENQLHSHAYRLEAIFEGDELDRHGYLLDIAEVEVQLGRIIERFAEKTLNDLPELAGQNPSLERFARLLLEAIAAALRAPTLTALTVKLWEHEQAFATCRIALR
jgi:6-pyruvoyltetrahydropterin/6-carboxytetrahydropterin synthase